METNNLNSECLICENQIDSYDTNNLLCQLDDCPADSTLRPNEKNKFISILPKSKRPIDLSVLPPLYYSNHNLDIFAISALDEFKNSQDYGEDKLDKLNELLPYKSDQLAQNFNLRCGNPILLSSKKFETELKNIDKSYILDFSPYLWSNTLKDPRSWAIINTALEYNIKNLALWTAGNAGYSLSKIVQTLNKLLNQENRLKVYNIYDSINEEIDPEIKFNIQVNNGIIQGIHSDGHIFSADEIYNVISNRVNLVKDDFWVVTDGLEGVGNEIYKLIFLQVLSNLKPTHIFIPIGTGNLFIAAYRSLKYLIKEKKMPITTKLIGALPYGNNIHSGIKNSETRNPTKQKISNEKIDPTRMPEMPKLVGEYSPLIQCLNHSFNEEFVDKEFVDSRTQNKAFDSLSRDFYLSDARIKFEPSSLAGFGALLNYQKKQIKCGKALIVNTGIGNIGRSEIEYLKGKSAPNIA